MGGETPAAEAPDVQEAVTELNVVAVHGVGAPETGSLLPGLLKAYARSAQSIPPEDHGVTFVEVRLTTEEGHAFAGLKATGPDGRHRVVTFWDANWAELERPPEGWAARIPFLARLLVATVAYAGGEGGAVRLFQIVFGTVLLWLPILPALSLWSMVLVPWWAFLLVSVAISGGAAYLTWQVRKVDEEAIKKESPWALVPLAYRAGIVWTALPLVGFAATLLFGREVLQPDRAGAVGTFAQAAVAVSIPISFLVALLFGKRRGMTVATHLSRMGLLALAAALVTSAAAVVLWANLFFADKLIESPVGVESPFGFASRSGFESWNQLYARALPYRIAAAEALTTGATLLIGGLLLLAVVGYGILTWGFGASWSGAAIRAAVQIIVWLTVVVFAATGLLLGCEIVDRMGPPWLDGLAGRVDWAIAKLLLWLPRDASGAVELPDDADILAVYGLAAVRALPFVGGLALGPVRAALDVMADILHYLHRPERQREPLRALLLALKSRGEVAVVGHSQGSRVAVDTIFGTRDLMDHGADKVWRLATTGSPIATLYGRFLGATDLPGALGGWTWANFWRGSDFIGGPIPPIPGNPPQPFDQPMKDNYLRTHIDYWDEPLIMAWLFSAPLPNRATR